MEVKNLCEWRTRQKGGQITTFFVLKTFLLLLWITCSSLPSPESVIPNEVRNLPKSEAESFILPLGRFLTSFGMTVLIGVISTFLQPF